MYNNPVYENEWIKRSVLIDKGILEKLCPAKTRNKGSLET